MLADNSRSSLGSMSPARWTKLGDHNFELSACLFSGSDSPLDYWCYDPEVNAFETTEHLCDHRGTCKNVSLFSLSRS